MRAASVICAAIALSFSSLATLAQSQRGWDNLFRDQIQGMQNWQPTEMPYELALKQAAECVQRNAKELDDRLSDASTVARATMFACLRERRLAVNAFQVREKRYSGETGVGTDLQKAEDQEVLAIVIAILKARAANR